MDKKINSFSRRKFIGYVALAGAGLAFAPRAFAGVKAFKPNSKFGGVQIGAITYSWRSMPSSAEDLLKYCVDGGISSIELMGYTAEEFAGCPQLPARPPRGKKLSDEEKKTYQEAREEATIKQKEWRLNAPMGKFKALRKMFNKAGVELPIVKFAPANWSDAEIDYAFEAAKLLGAKGITNEIGHDACKRLGRFAEKHDMYAVFHNHAQPGEPGFSFDEFLAYSPKNMLNFDAGHYMGATGNHPNVIIERLHDRILSVHLKDKTAKDATPPNTNRPWGEGDTPLADILQLIQKNNWPIYCDIELEYEVPADSDAQQEIVKCVQYCKNILS